MKFRVADIAYPFALFATSVGAFGFGRGVLAFLIVAIFWAAARKLPRPTLIEWLVVAGIILVLIGLLLPAFDVARESARVATCRNCMRQLALALYTKALTPKGRLPQAIVRDDLGYPMHSWRASILRHIDEQSTFEQYDWSQPWNSPANRALGVPIEVFGCPSDPAVGLNASHTNYFAIIGSRTAWPDERGLPTTKITDGMEDTILLLEAFNLNVPWIEPRDLSFAEAVDLLTGRAPDRLAHRRYEEPGYFYRWRQADRRGVHAAFADGTVRFLPVPLPEEMAKALLTANAGDQVDWNEFERLTAPQLDYAKIYATIAFSIVALWPARRALRKRPA
jgi:hypothetical protein